MDVSAIEEPKVAVVGAGSWGTAFAAIPAEKGVETALWARRPELAEEIAARHQNPDYLPGFDLPPSLLATGDLEKALHRASVVVLAVPSPNLPREVVRRRPSPSVGACVDDATAESLQSLFMAPFFRVYTNPDVVG